MQAFKPSITIALIYLSYWLYNCYTFYLILLCLTVFMNVCPLEENERFVQESTIENHITHFFTI